MSGDIDRDHDAANMDNFIWEATKLEDAEWPGMPPPHHGKSAAEAIRLLSAQANQASDARSTLRSTLGHTWNVAGMHTAPNIATMEPKMHAKILEAPELKRPWYRRLLGFLLVRWYLRRR